MRIALTLSHKEEEASLIVLNDEAAKDSKEVSQPEIKATAEAS